MQGSATRETREGRNEEKKQRSELHLTNESLKKKRNEARDLRAGLSSPVVLLLGDGSFFDLRSPSCMLYSFAIDQRNRRTAKKGE